VARYRSNSASSAWSSGPRPPRAASRSGRRRAVRARAWARRHRATFRGWDVPEVLRSGDHARVARWRRAQALARTARLRPDLLEARGGLTAEDRALLAEFDL
jgi:hypothetical protein